MKCEVILKKGKVCGNSANYKVRHKDKKENKSFLVCEEHIAGYKYVMLGECSFIVKELKKGDEDD